MKKKIIIALSVIALCFGLIGCNSTTNENFVGNIGNENIVIWTDKETGVQYVIYHSKVGYAGMGGITPRLNADGSLYVENKESEE